MSNTFQEFFDSEKSSGILLIICTAISLLIANSSNGADYLGFWQTRLGGLSIEHWTNDALMAIFFLLIGLELERELYVGELSNFKNALLPIFAAIGGMAAPALIHFSLNAGTPSQAGIGIPMATDIAFALGVLAILGHRIPASLKGVVVAFAVLDDLGAIVIIAAFYTAQLSVWYLAGALAVWALLIALNRFRVMSLVPYLLGGALMWFSCSSQAFTRRLPASCSPLQSRSPLMTTTKSHPHTSSNIFYTTRGDGRQYGPNGFEAVGAIAVMKPDYSFDSRRAMKRSALLIVNVQAS